jgi:hypothetical protein
VKIKLQQAPFWHPASGVNPVTGGTKLAASTAQRRRIVGWSELRRFHLRSSKPSDLARIHRRLSHHPGAARVTFGFKPKVPAYGEEPH